MNQNLHVVDNRKVSIVRYEVVLMVKTSLLARLGRTEANLGIQGRTGVQILKENEIPIVDWLLDSGNKWFVSFSITAYKNVFILD